MAVSVTPNIVAGSRLRYGPTGGAYVTVHDVWGLSASADNLVTAIGQGISLGQVPAYAAPHPTIQGFYMAEYESEPIQDASRTGVKIFCIYRTAEWLPNATYVEVISSNGTKTYSTWTFGPQKGNPIIIGYAPQGGSFIYPLPPPGDNPPDGTYYNFALYEALSPNTILRITRRDAFGPMTLSRKYRRTVNSDTWLGGAPGTWLCRGIDGKNLPVVTSLFPGGGYLNEYCFEYNPDGWIQVALFQDRITGEIPQNIKIDGTNNGYSPIQPYPAVAFNNSDFNFNFPPNL